jgi:hypothetical protein
MGRGLRSKNPASSVVFESVVDEKEMDSFEEHRDSYKQRQYLLLNCDRGLGLARDIRYKIVWGHWHLICFEFEVFYKRQSVKHEA